jgi:BirA family biotin operon repressor/biotin-[acetyl-CoA-carboxylase] ligase
MTKPLFSSPDDADKYAAALPTRAIGKALRYLARTSSTNDLAMRAARADAPHGVVFISDHQDAGRGRRGRSWQAEPNQSLLLSIVIRPPLDPADFSWVPLCAGLAGAQAVSDACGVQAAVKWPNDIVVPSQAAPGWRKLGGVLCESVLEAGTRRLEFCAVVGIGLNIHQTADALPAIAKAPPTSVFLETRKEVDRLAVLAALLESFERQLDALSDASRRAALKNEIEQRLKSWWTPETMLRAQVPGQGAVEEVSGRFNGLDVFGRLKLQCADGRELTLTDAEIISAMPDR